MALMLLLWLVAFAFPQVVKVDKQQLKRLGIQTYELRLSTEQYEIKLPAEVKEYLPESSEVYPPVGGIVREVYVKEGDYVKKGQPLALVYSPQVAELRSQLRMAEVRLKTAEETLKREELLFKEEVIPYARYYSAKVEYDRAKGEYRALMESLRSFGEVKGDNLVVRAPTEGYVVKQEVRKGSSVDLSKRMFLIVSNRKVWVFGYAPYEISRSIRKGMKAYVVVEGTKLEGIVDYVGGYVDQKIKRVPIRALVEQKKSILKPGGMVDLVVVVGQVKGFLVPSEAVQRIEGKSYLFVEVPEGFKLVEVRPIKEVKGKTLVEGPLKEGDRVAMSGLVFLRSVLGR